MNGTLNMIAFVGTFDLTEAHANADTLHAQADGA